MCLMEPECRVFEETNLVGYQMKRQAGDEILDISNKQSQQISVMYQVYFTRQDSLGFFFSVKAELPLNM